MNEESRVFAGTAHFVTIEQVKSFVAEANKMSGYIAVRSVENYVVSGRSLLGIFGIDLSEPVAIECDENNYASVNALCKQLNLLVEE